MHVLIATDGSDDAVAAASQALSLLAPTDTISLVCVVEAPTEATAGQESGFAGGLAEPEAIDAAWDEVNREANVALDHTIAALGSPATISRRIETGGPGPVICRVAEEAAVDVVVVGSRGRGAIRRALLGSVSTHVANNAPCPVIIVRAS